MKPQNSIKIVMTGEDFACEEIISLNMAGRIISFIAFEKHYEQWSKPGKNNPISPRG